MPRATIGVRSRGKIIVVKILIRLAPSMAAASSNSSGMPRTYCRSRNTPNALNNAAGRMIDACVSTRLNHPMIVYSGMIVSWIGTIIVARNRPNRRLFPGNFNRANAYAAIAQVSSETTVITVAM